MDVLKGGLRRQSGRQVVIDGLPAGFCSDAGGILCMALGTGAGGDAALTGLVVEFVAKIKKNLYDLDRTEDWQRVLFAAADQLLGGSPNIPIAKSGATADVRTALAARGLISASDNCQTMADDMQTLELAIREPQNELNCDRAALRLAAVESLIYRATPSVGEESIARSA